ncbi:hypothetical protein M408DRAFT_331812, partial [Serendipita vermifera MAFF 305830]
MRFITTIIVALVAYTSSQALAATLPMRGGSVDVLEPSEHHNTWRSLETRDIEFLERRTATKGTKKTTGKGGKFKAAALALSSYNASKARGGRGGRGGGGGRGGRGGRGGKGGNGGRGEKSCYMTSQPRRSCNARDCMNGGGSCRLDADGICNSTLMTRAEGGPTECYTNCRCD